MSFQRNVLKEILHIISYHIYIYIIYIYIYIYCYQSSLFNIIPCNYCIYKKKKKMKQLLILLQKNY